MGKKLEDLLHERIGPLPFVGDIRGRGLFWAVELVMDKRSKTPFTPEADLSNTIVRSALKNGLNILGNLGYTGKYYVDHVIICPPYFVTDNDLEQILLLLRDSIIEASRSSVE